ncbi:GntR family transcriptional regulator [Methylobacterium frigidaeris]|uniref:HTH-type transcriptional regulator LutR n=1 Tax=Methylobacterium frigidaeris TaxID=2038277 RepID=A0AA37HGL5_9HYPH|nr:GntR family transcriptional regulator [Methylobacterium frigidaeris]PIK69337.1 GntR family transcriptional regulator [Methylobacterium frigidaeris]GJD65671.1 HTH-type transcriptional regulator LutR [Methylobacterium frigidaeris]
MDDAAGRTRTERLAAEIAEAIVTGTLAPGSRLDEQALADQYGVSRTPVREALRQLGTSGLVEVRPRRGAVVAQVTAAQLADLFVAMAEIEATCARLAAQSMSPLERRRLDALHDAMGDLARTDDPASYARANTAFHGAIYAGAHNAVLSDFALSLRRRLQPYREAQFRLEGRLARSHAEHGAVVAAILAGQAVEAHAAMLRHVTLVESSVEGLLAREGVDEGGAARPVVPGTHGGARRQS